MMYSIDFLRRLDQDRHKVTYAKIVRLSWDEIPQEEIEGRVTAGSINIDGSSATRRSFSLTMVSETANLSEYYWGMNTKIKLSIGVENHIDSNYPDIIWFEQGVFIITQLSSSYSTSSYTINLNGRDKMCLLDGTVSGTLNSTVDFGKWEEVLDLGEKQQVYKYFKKPVGEIIREAVHQFAGEPFHNIIIKDLPEYGYVLQEYRFNNAPMFLWRKAEENIDTPFLSATIDGNTKVYYNGGDYTLATLPSKFMYDSLNTFAPTEVDSTPSSIKFKKNGSDFYLAKIETGEPAGYTLTELVYPSDLIENSGSTIMALLDKIKNFLGNFEYFYNIDGQFIFQKKKTYQSENWNPLQDKGYSIGAPVDSQYAYEFNDSSLFTTISFNPSLGEVKNDFTVWGTKKSADGNEFPLHMRVAIDRKPVTYTSITVTDSELTNYNEKYDLNVKGQIGKTYKAKDGIMIKDDYSSEYYLCDWRELLYQMAKDWSKYNHLDDFNLRVAKSNPQFKNGITGYEQYYIDIEGFWRTIYEPVDTNEYLQIANEYSRLQIETQIQSIEQQIKNTNIESEKTSLNEQLEIWKTRLKVYTYNDQFYLFYKNSKTGPYVAYEDSKLWWTRALIENPSRLQFWLDFIEPVGDFARFGVPALGSRPKVDSENKAKAIANLEAPKLLFGDLEKGQTVPAGYVQLQVGKLGQEMFSKSSQGLSASEIIDQLLFQHTYCAESISITSVPIYYLEPNTRVYIKDEDSGIDGDYLINSISLNLTYNGTMSLNLVKAPTILV